MAGKAKISAEQKRLIKEFLKEKNLTSLDMDNFWYDACTFNTKCAMLNRSGMSWENLHISVIKTIPDLKQKYLAEEAERIAKEQQKNAEANLGNKLTGIDLVVNKLKNNKELTEDEIKLLVYELEIECEYGENDDWDRPVTSIVQVENKFYAVQWRQGLTEMQPDEYMEQPYKVEKT